MTQVLKLKNELKELNKLAEFINQFVMDNNLSKRNVFDLNLILEEHFVNIVSYAFSDDAVHIIEFYLEILDSGKINICVTDDGKEFDPTVIKNTEIGLSEEERSIGGLGIHFIKTLTQKFEYNRYNNKNKLNMLYNIKM